MDCKVVAHHVKNNVVVWMNMAAVLLGVGLGFGLRSLSLHHKVIFWLGLPGHMMLAFLEMVIVPVCVSSIIVGISSVHINHHKIVLTLLLILITITNIIAATTGLSLGYIITQIQFDHPPVEGSSELRNGTDFLLADIFRNLVPRSILRASFQSERSVSSVEEEWSWQNDQVTYTNVPNMMGLVCLSLLVGIVAAGKRKETNILTQFFHGVMTVGFTMMTALTWVAPLGLASLTCVAIIQVGSVSDMFIQLTTFTSLQIAANMVYQSVLLPLLVVVVNLCRRGQVAASPWTIVKTSFRTLLITFATASPAIVLPDIYKVCARLRLSDDVITTGVPVVFSMTTTGCGIFVTMATIFLADLSRVTLTTAEIIKIGMLTVTSTLSFGNVPSGSVVGLLVVTQALGVSTEHLGLLLAVEWIVDRVRSTTSVLTTIVCVYMTDHLSSHTLTTTDVMSSKDQRGSTHSLTTTDVMSSKDQRGSTHSLTTTDVMSSKDQRGSTHSLTTTDVMSSKDQRGSTHSLTTTDVMSSKDQRGSTHSLTTTDVMSSKDMTTPAKPVQITML